MELYTAFLINYLLIAIGLICGIIGHKKSMKEEAAIWVEARRQYQSYGDTP